jgi:hypothetical protein
VFGKYLYYKHWLRVFEVRAPRKTFDPKRDEMQEEVPKLHNEEPYDLYCSTNVIWGMKSGIIGRSGLCSTYRRKERCF